MKAMAGTAFVLTAVNASDADQDVRVKAIRAMSAESTYQSSYFDNCALDGYSGNSRTFNVVVRELGSNGQHLLLDHPGQVYSATLPSDKCAQGEGNTPCGRILWLIRSADTSKDGAIDGRDALMAYASDLDARQLVALSPPDASVLGTHWVVPTDKWQLQVRRDTNKDGVLSEEDGAELIETSTRGSDIGTPFLQDSIRKALNAAIQ